MALEDNTEIVYKTTEFYAPDHECSILWNDPDIGITWPSGIEPKLSEKDQQAVTFSMHQKCKIRNKTIIK